MSVMPGRDHARPANPGVKLTYEDFVLFPDDGKRHELIDGEHYVTPSPNVKHQAISINLSAMIWSYLQERPIGRIFAAPLTLSFRTLMSLSRTFCISRTQERRKC